MIYGSFTCFIYLLVLCPQNKLLIAVTITHLSVPFKIKFYNLLVNQGKPKT